MSWAASVERREHLRLFCALTLPDDAVQALGRWQRDELACNARIMPSAHLHVTLAFLGSRPSADVERVASALRGAASSAEGPLVLHPQGYRETRSVGMLVLDDEGGHAGRLASDLHARLERLGLYEPEARRWMAHVTVLRFRQRPRLAPSLPDLRPFSPSGAAVYHSVLRPGGARYEVLESVGLGG